MSKSSSFMIDNLLGNNNNNNDITNAYLKKRECITPPLNNVDKLKLESNPDFAGQNQSTPVFNLNHRRDDYLMHQYYAYYYASALSYQKPGLNINTCSMSLNSSGSPSYSTTSSSNTSNNLSSIDYSPIQQGIKWDHHQYVNLANDARKKNGSVILVIRYSIDPLCFRDISGLIRAKSRIYVMYVIRPFLPHHLSIRIEGYIVERNHMSVTFVANDLLLALICITTN